MMNPTTAPVRKPSTTCESVCWRSIMRLVPTAPANTRMKQSHHVGLKSKMKDKAIRAPKKPPIAAVWVLIFHQMLMMAQTI